MSDEGKGTTKAATTDRYNGAKDGKKSPSKPVSLYPMSEEEALQRLLRVPPPSEEYERGANRS